MNHAPNTLEYVLPQEWADALTLIVPRDAFVSPEEVETAYQAMHRWQLGVLR